MSFKFFADFFLRISKNFIFGLLILVSQVAKMIVSRDAAENEYN
jgi:hypothetical protein